MSDAAAPSAIFDPSKMKKKKSKKSKKSSKSKDAEAEDVAPIEAVAAEPAYETVVADVPAPVKPEAPIAPVDEDELLADQPDEADADLDAEDEVLPESAHIATTLNLKKRKKRLRFLTPLPEDLWGDLPAVQAPERSEAPLTRTDDRDYTYTEMLDRVFSILHADRPELAGASKRRVMKPPKVQREGSKKTVFSNFSEICQALHRQQDHFLAFLMTELGTDGSIDGNDRLVIKGRFQSKNIEIVLRRYINEFVMCHGCRSIDTLLMRENRMYFVQCEHCGAHRSVQSIHKGFVADLSRRRKR
eukprot:gnl/Ergobibamus_cyprinoides/2076.p1 GENE.gnl/Ergobibamus_cyprinoides/2076~~gnl/Ergobibamus_cyprinoides/2076.p1  ORF type:complete len:312 (+),score=134.23 gnl/Ergobibamus_cyprinoides/2076:31-936(+)